MDPNMHEKLVSTLTNAQSERNDIREQAEAGLKEVREHQPGWYIMGLTRAVAEETGGNKQLAAILLKKAITIQDLYKKLSPEQQSGLRAYLIQFIQGIDDEKVSKQIEDAISLLCFTHLAEENKWPEIVAFLTSPNEGRTQLRIMRIIGECCVTKPLADEGPAFKNEIEKALACDHIPTKVAAVKAYVSFVSEPDLPHMNVWATILPQIINVLDAVITNNHDDVKNVMEAITDVATNNHSFYTNSPHTQALVEAMFAMMGHPTKEFRHHAGDFLTTLAEAAPRQLKRVPKFIATLCQKLIDLIEKVPEPDEQWALHDDDSDSDDDEEGASDTDFGLQGLTVLAESFGGKTLEPVLAELLKTLLSSPDWRKHYAAISVLTACAEGCHTTFKTPHVMQSFTEIIVKHVSHEHPKVRQIAADCLGEFCQQFSPEYEEKYSNHIVECSLKLMSDEIPKIRKSGLSIMSSFAEDADADNYAQYHEQLLQEIYKVLTRENEQLFVIEEAVTALSDIAFNMDKAFLKYFDTFIPVLTNFFSFEDDKYHELVGKTIECLAGIATCTDEAKLNENNFLDKFRAGMWNIMNKAADDDVRQQYINKAWVSLASTGEGQLIKPYLEKVVESCVKTMHAGSTDCLSIPQKEGISLTDDTPEINLHTSKLEDAKLACALIETIYENLPDDMQPYYEAVMKVVEPLLTCLYDPELRETAVKLLPYIVHNVKRGDPGTMVAKLIHILDCLITAMKSEMLVVNAATLMETFGKVLEESGAKNVLPEEKVAEYQKTLLEMFTESRNRKQLATNEQQQEDIKHDEDEQEKIEQKHLVEGEFLLQSALCIGSCLKTHPLMFIPHFIKCFLPLVTEMIQSRDNHDKKLAYSLLDDFLAYGELAVMPFFHDIFAALIHGATAYDDVIVAQDVAYGLKIAATFGNDIKNVPDSPGLPQEFTKKAMTAAHKIASNWQKKDWGGAVVNAASAMLKLLELYPNEPNVNDTEVLPFVLQLLPTHGDQIECIVVHDVIFNHYVMQRNPLVCGEAGKNIFALQAIARKLIEDYTDEDARAVDEKTLAMLTAFIETTPQKWMSGQ